MSVYKVLDLVGSSTVSWQDAVEVCVSEASKTIDNIVGVEVMNNTAKIEDGKITEYKSNVHISFRVEH
ncbi:MAG: dodecin domain-containing protein [Firmicutes bacterium]|nr:dodecin domain-containing protein [Bacillota bacterium]